MIQAPLIAAAVAWAGFAVWYMIRARWWKHAHGWNTLGTSMVLAVIFGRLALLTYAPDLSADLRWLGFVVYVLAIALGIHRFYLLEAAQRHQRPNE